MGVAGTAEAPNDAPELMFPNSSTLDTDDSLKGIASLFNLCKNVLGRCGPDEVSWTPKMRQVAKVEPCP